MNTFFRPRRPQAPVWTTGDGRQLPLDEMEDEHLANTIQYLMRKKMYWERAQADALEHGTDLGELIISNLTVDQWLANLYAEVRRRQS